MNGGDDFWLAFAGGLGLGLYLNYRSYERTVGVENASIRGWRVWSVQQKNLRRAQPRRSMPAGWVMIAVTLGLTTVAGHTALVGLYWVAVITALLACLALGRHAPPADQVRAINAEHRTGRHA